MNLIVDPARQAALRLCRELSPLTGQDRRRDSDQPAGVTTHAAAGLFTGTVVAAAGLRATWGTVFALWSCALAGVTVWTALLAHNPEVRRALRALTSRRHARLLPSDIRAALNRAGNLGDALDALDGTERAQVAGCLALLVAGVGDIRARNHASTPAATPAARLAAIGNLMVGSERFSILVARRLDMAGTPAASVVRLAGRVYEQQHRRGRNMADAWPQISELVAAGLGRVRAFEACKHAIRSDMRSGQYTAAWDAVARLDAAGPGALRIAAELDEPDTMTTSELAQAAIAIDSAAP